MVPVNTVRIDRYVEVSIRPGLLMLEPERVPEFVDDSEHVVPTDNVYNSTKRHPNRRAILVRILNMNETFKGKGQGMNESDIGGDLRPHAHRLSRDFLTFRRNVEIEVVIDNSPWP